MADYSHRGRVSSFLELEAAEFFKIDLGHMRLGPNSNKSALDLRRHISPSSASSSGSLNQFNASTPFTQVKPSAIKMQGRSERATVARSNESIHEQRRAARSRPAHQKSRQQTEFKIHHRLTVQPQQQTHNASKHRRQHQKTTMTNETMKHNAAARSSHTTSGWCSRPAAHELAACSSASSTNSLPSISSSPSVSPSLVCPHLSLDDILAYRQAPNGSPHTVGLCPRCRLDPPPNIHSPLSPHFRPHHKLAACSPCAEQQAPPRIRRGHSDHQAVSQEARKRRLAASSGLPLTRQKSDLTRARDDSLDFGLGAGELRRMQMSPSLRNSVEFIRRNSIESGRVVRVYKNGQPFEKPLRVCILRDEFSSLNHLLDHINSRLLVPNGARFLFHIDGQPVYSVHELKHGSVYVVSGKRQYDYRTSEVLRERQLKEQLALADKLANSSQECRGRSSARQEQERISGSGEINKGRMQQVSDGRPIGVTGRRGRDAPPSRVSGPNRPLAGTMTIRAPNKSMGPIDTQLANERVRAGVAISSGSESSGRIGDLKKFSRYDDSTSLSAGGLNASTQSILAATDEGPARLTRAKSELSALPTRGPKKNVTFMDTGRGSSPAISELSSQGKDSTTTTTRTSDGVSSHGDPAGTNLILQETLTARGRDLSTSEIGIQVSDSIDGFLIDLPVALPAKGDDSNLEQKRDATRAANATARAINGRTAAGKPRSSTKMNSERPKQIVTITERQLSLEEMQELQDLSAGDHHHEITIKWDTPPGDGISGQESEAENKAEAETEPDVVPDRTNTIAIGTDPQPQPQQVGESARLITSASVGSKKMNETNETDEAANQWQYPGGRESSATPTERPVSQSGPSETVRARVTTPTPSLSTCGDNNSLTMSYETISQSGDMQPASKANRAERLRSTPSELPPKERAEVRGTLCSGLDEPARNFRLVWVNGFAINDLYPENTYNVAQEWTPGGGEARASGRVSGTSSPGARLTPGLGRPSGAGQRPALTTQGGVNSFKPSERYHNWICHSRKHDELLYPAGSLIVLWCRWTNEQRYYARHTSNVSALTLATLDLDLAASAQVCDLNERPPIASNIHLWSLTSLDTLLVIQDEQFRLKLIFSLRLKNTKTTGCELSIAARDEKQLLLFEYNGKLPASSETKTSRNQSNQGQQQQQQPAAMMRAMKLLQINQLPLFLLRVPNISESQTSKQQAMASGEPIISFGRRHFNIWSTDAKQKKLRPMQSDQKNAKFVELIAKANCLCRLSPGEFLAGDSDGNVALLLINCRTIAAPEALNASPRVKRAAARTPITGPDANSKYSLELINLLGPSVARASQLNNENGGANNLAQVQTYAITCLTRVTGSLFMSADSTCTIRFWKIKRAPRRDERKNSVPTVRLASSSVMEESTISCEQLSSISLPPDLGFICTLIMAQYNLRESFVEFYVVSTSNTILFGSVKLPNQYTRPSCGTGSTTPAQAERRPPPPPPQQVDLLANSSLSVVYEGHETSASSLVADFQLEQDAHTGQLSECQYFTCSLDCRICKWQGKQLVWKSLLPSSCATLAVHPTGFVLAVGSLDGTVYILDKVSGLLISYFPLTPVRINCLAYSRDGSLLAAACANGSIFMLPVYERGLKYKKVSIFQSPHPVVSLQFSMDNRYMLTSVTHGAYQELILWDLPNFRYMRDNVELAADKIRWFDSICSGSEDVRAIWENANMSSLPKGESQLEGDTKRSGHKRPKPSTAVSTRRVDTSTKRDPFVVNLSCHRLIKTDRTDDGATVNNYVVASDTRGYLRLFRYPSYDIQQGFFAIRISSSAVNCCRFLRSSPRSNDHFVSTSLDGSICLWAIE